MNVPTSNLDITSAATVKGHVSMLPPVQDDPRMRSDSIQSANARQVFVDKLPDEELLHQGILKHMQAANEAESGNQPQASASIIDDQMLDQSIKMLCETHKAPAVFFSEKEDRYVCFKCLVASEKLLYIDKNYSEEMEDFERIKKMTSEAITNNM